MSKVPRPGSSGLPSRKPATKKTKAAPTPAAPQKFELPAFSIPATGTRKEIDFEKLKKDTIRRHSPAGEDLKQIQATLKGLKNQQVSAEEFVNLISAFTADNGSTLRSVMAEDLTSFRKLAKKVYETMTQDVSDVLLNEQVDLTQYYDEKHGQFSDRMMRCINELFQIIPNFDFEKFHAQGEEYLNVELPLPSQVQRDPEDVEMQRRQEAYHRLQWLRTEGDRLNEENSRLIQRLDDLKQQQKVQQSKAMDMAEKAEIKRQNLQAEESAIKETLEQINDSFEKSVIENEATICHEANAQAKSIKSKEALKARKRTGTIRKKRADWVASAAADIEEHQVEQTLATETKSAKSSMLKMKMKRRPKSPHFSPIKTPPPREAAAKPASPFHFSPIKTPPAAPQSQQQRSPFHYSPPRQPQAEPFRASPPSNLTRETRTEEANSTTTRSVLPQARRNMAPRDSWGGF